MMKYFEVLQQYTPQEVEAEAPVCLNDVAIIKDTVDDEILLRNTFANGSTKSIKAIAVVIRMWDVFGELVRYNGNEEMNYVYQDITFSPQSIFGNTVPIKLPDNVRKVDVSIDKVVLEDGTIWKTNREHVVHTEPQELIEGPDGFIESISEDNQYPALFLYVENDKCWQCTCGGVNLKQTAFCYRCGRRKITCASEYTPDNMNQKLTVYKQEADRVAEENKKKEREKAEKEREEQRERVKKEREEQERLQEIKKAEEKKKARKRNLTISVFVGIAIVACVAFIVWRNITFGLSKEDEEKYKVALTNFQTIDRFQLDKQLDYSSIVGSYFDYDDPFKSQFDNAFSNGEYMAKRALFLEVAPLYKQIQEQFPEKYHDVYSRLIKLKKSEILSEVTRKENTNLSSSYNKKYGEENEAIEEEVERVARYMTKDVFDPSSVKEKEVPTYSELKSSDYTFGEKMSYSILYYDSGEIKYIGEIRDGEAYGIGVTYYSSEEKKNSTPDRGLSIKEEGLYIDGKLVDGEIWSVDGEKKEVHDQSELETYYEEFLKSKKKETKSSSKSKGSESKAKSAAKEYLQMLVNKQSSIKSISFTGSSYNIGDDYYFEVSVETTAGTRKGEVECNMSTNGTYSVSGLQYY